MTASYLGSASLGAFCPVAVSAQAVAVGQLPDVQARIAGALAVQASLTVAPPDFDGTVSALAAVAASLQLVGPSVTLQVGAVAALLAELELLLLQLQAMVSIGVLLGSPGIHGYTYTGKVANAADQIRDVLQLNPPGAPADQAGGVLLMASTPAAVQAVGTFYGVVL